jgi:hypothetical protein
MGGGAPGVGLGFWAASVSMVGEARERREGVGEERKESGEQCRPSVARIVQRLSRVDSVCNKFILTAKIYQLLSCPMGSYNMLAYTYNIYEKQCFKI